MPIEFQNVTLAPLENFSASAPGGAIIGILGVKGSGASELLKLAAGVEQPSAGEISAGPQRRLVKLGDTLNLAPADVLSLDQALAVQDALVRARTVVGLDRLRRAGSTILLATHEEKLLESLCDEIWWLVEGRLMTKGDPREVLEQYRRWLAAEIRNWGDTLPPRLAPSARRGDGRAEILSLEPLGETGRPTVVWKSGEEASVRVSVQFNEAIAEPVIGIMIRTQIGFEVFGTNSELEKVQIGPCAAGDVVRITFSFRCDLCPQGYTITAASHDPDGSAHDWLDDAVAVQVTDNRYTAGVANLRARVALERAEAMSPSRGA